MVIDTTNKLKRKINIVQKKYFLLVRKERFIFLTRVLFVKSTYELAEKI